MMLTKERKGEIAWLLAKAMIKQESLKLDPVAVKRNIGNKAKELGVSLDELKIFTTEIFSELFKEFTDELKK